MALSAGAHIGPYEVTAPIGAGGMGEVYRARDTKLGRDVALKVLPDAFALDPDRLARFMREARVLAALNHPNIATIYGLEEAPSTGSGQEVGVRALVLELVEGPTLEDLIAHGRPTPEAESLRSRPRDSEAAAARGGGAPRGLKIVVDALHIARQIAEALEAAHEQGIIHRDLKPANVKVRPDGTVKVLDFGLAKLTQTLGSGPGDQDELTQSPTITAPAFTKHGVVLGTAAYMSPEQARGKPVDKRADVWAFGALLYEMLAGRAAFAGETIPDTISTVLGREPQWTSLPRSTPSSIRRLLERCLEKDLRRRLHDIADARIEIEDALSAPAPIAPVAERSAASARGGAPWLVAAAAVAAATVLAFLAFGDRRATSPARSVHVQRLTDLVGLEEAPAISPDGKVVAFVAASEGKRHIWVRLLAGGAPLALTKDDIDHYSPRWSPDSSSLIYYTPGAQPGEAGTIWEIPALGGSAQRLVTALGPGDISHDGNRLAFVRFNEGTLELAIAARNGSPVQRVSKLPAGTYYSLKWSPDDRRLAVVQEPGGLSFAANLIIVDVSNGTSRHITGEFLFQGMSWAQDGSGLIVSSSRGSLMSYPPTYNLWVVPLDGGAPSQLTFGESSYESPDLGRGGIVASRVRAQADVSKFPATGDPADNARNGVRITRQTGLVQTVSVSPDESDVVLLSDNGGHANVWTARVEDGAMRPLTREFDPRVVVAVPVWSPQGDWVNFLSNRDSRTAGVTLWLVRRDGSDTRNLAAPGAWACWSGDGQWLYFSDLVNATYHIKKARIDGGETVSVRDDHAIGCQVAPDGSALYYARILTQATGAWDFEIRRAVPESGPSVVIGRVAGSRVPATAINFHAFLSPDGKSLAMPLLDGSTTNVWALSTSDGEWRKLTDFGERNVMIARRIAWSRDGRHIYAAVSEVDSDIVMLTGLQ